MLRKTPFLLFLIGLILLGLMVFSLPANAHSGGISGHSISGCNSCHPGSPLPTSVTLTGPTSVASGSTNNTYTLTVTGGAAVVGGLDVSHSAGTFTIIDSTTQLLNNEVTHNAPKTFSTSGSVSWTMNWIAPTVTANTTANLYASGLSSDGSGPGGGSLSISLPITVTAAVVATAPSITAQPASLTVTAGQGATFSVTATGTAPLSYQWKKGTTNVGTNSATFSIATTTAADAGSYAVVVTNSAGSVASNTATLTVNPAAVAPSIATQPASLTVTAGSPASFSVVATGTAPLSYQWMKGTTNIGTNSATYSIASATAADAGTYTVVVSNTAGNATSNAATLTVNSAPVAPSITAQPASLTVTAGSPASFSVVATGTAPLSYQWKKGTTNVGTNSATFSIASAAATDAGSYTVVVTNSAGTVASTAATLTVNPAAVAPSITTQPASLTVTAGSPASFSVVATGTAPLSYQWKKGTTNVGTNSATFSIASATAADAGTYTVVVSNTVGNATSNAATLTVNPATVPSMAVSPNSLAFTYTTGGPAPAAKTFAVMSSGVALSYTVASSGSSWLSATGGGTTPGNVSVSVNPTGLAAGTYNGTVSVTASSASNSPQNVAVTLTVTSQDRTPPTIAINSPQPNSVLAGVIELTATASDNVGVVGVRYQLDGTQVGTEQGSAPYSVAWNTGGTSNGTHVITATARDAAGNTATASVTVQVSNAGMSPGGVLGAGLDSNTKFQVQQNGISTLIACASCWFQSAADLLPGQTLEVRLRAGASPPVADTVILKQGPIDGTITQVSGTQFTLQPSATYLPAKVLVITGSATNLNGLTPQVGQNVSVRGILLKNSSSGGPTLIATIVELR